MPAQTSPGARWCRREVRDGPDGCTQMTADLPGVRTGRPRVAAIIAAGGRGTRLGAGLPKQLLALGGQSMLELSVTAIARSSLVGEIVLVLPSELAAEPPAWADTVGKPVRVVAGGPRRQDSVAAGFAAISDDIGVVVVHDAARPFVTEALIAATVAGALETGAAIAALPARDTIKLARADSASDEGGGARVLVARTIPREEVFLAQTPQAFRRDVLAAAIAAGTDGEEATDEAALAERAGFPVQIVAGDPRNMKITTSDDLEAARTRLGDGVGLRAGTGYDLHRLVDGRPLVIGGVSIPFERGLAGHSDADVLAHAITDAVLGAAAAGDIGRHFPDSDQQWRGVSSLDLLARAAAIVREAGFTVVNVDAVVIAERPKLAPHIESMRDRLAGALRIDREAVAVKGKTNEGVGEIGRGEAIAAHAVALLARVGL